MYRQFRASRSLRRLKSLLNKEIKNQPAFSPPIARLKPPLFRRSRHPRGLVAQESPKGPHDKKMKQRLGHVIKMPWKARAVSVDRGDDKTSFANLAEFETPRWLGGGVCEQAVRYMKHAWIGASHPVPLAFKDEQRRRERKKMNRHAEGGIATHGQKRPEHIAQPAEIHPRDILRAHSGRE